GTGRGIMVKWDAVNGINHRSFSFFLWPSGQASLYVDADGQGNVEQHVDSSQPVPLDEWTYVVATYDGSKLQLYVNGVLDASVDYNLGIYPGTDDLGIGACVGGEPDGPEISPFVGLIDEAAIYNQALS